MSSEYLWEENIVPVQCKGLPNVCLNRHFGLTTHITQDIQLLILPFVNHDLQVILKGESTYAPLGKENLFK